MKYIKTPLLLIIIFLVTPASAQSFEQVFTLTDLYTLADKHSKSIKIFELAVTGAEQEISIAKNAFLPNIDITASASYNGNAWVADRDFSNGQFFSTPHFGNEFSVEASQVVFAGGAIHNNIKSLKIKKQISEWDLADHRQQIYFLLTGYYLDLYKYRNLLVVYDRNMKQTQEVIKNMRAREAAGVALNNDITRYEVQYQNLSYKRTELISSIEIYNDKLVTLLELPAQTEILPDSTLLSVRLLKPDVTEFQEKATKYSPTLNRNRLTIDMLAHEKKVTRAEYMPQISILAGDNLKGPITYEIPTLNNNINAWYIGIGLNFNISNMYKAPKKISRINTSITEAQTKLMSTEERVALNVRSAYIHYLDSSELLKTQEKSLQLARENYEVIANRYANDLVLVTDLVDADNLRLAAEVQYVNAQINVIYNYCKLLYEAGLLHTEK